MNRNDPLLRIARQINQRLTQQADKLSPDLIQLINELLESGRAVESVWQKIQKAHRHGWHLAAGQLRDELFSEVDNVAAQANQLSQQRQRYTQAEKTAPTWSFLVEELRQLQRELEDVVFQPKENQIVAKTEPIELEGLALGPFAIELNLNHLADHPDSSCFSCIALEPNPASTDERITHPHVREGALCAGDATVAIRDALKQGRIADAFTVVHSVLQTYNPNSPYVSIDDWDGVRCHDCDTLVGRDDLMFCDACEHDFCNECMSSCDLCDASYCRNCLEEDEVSHHFCCPSCRRTCRKCGRTVDTETFVEETELCPACHKEESKASLPQEKKHASPRTPKSRAARVEPAVLAAAPA